MFVFFDDAKADSSKMNSYLRLLFLIDCDAKKLASGQNEVVLKTNGNELIKAKTTSIILFLKQLNFF